MKIAIRADGGNNIGMGHIMRTLVLAQELAKEHEVFYVCKAETVNNFSTGDGSKVFQVLYEDKYRQGIEKIIEKDFKVVIVRDDFLIEDLKKIEAELLITDSYDVDENYFNKTKQIFKKTAYIDDVNLHYFNVDFLINQNVNAKDFIYKANKDTKLLLGPKYIMLRKEFRQCERKKIDLEVNNIMITMGGSDSYNITENILKWVEDMPYNFHVVVGLSFVNAENLKRFEGKNIKLYFNANMKKTMLNCDIAISACGSTLYELAALGIPSLGIIVANNQEAVAKKLENMNIIKNLGWYNNLNKDEFVYSINTICEDYSLRKFMSKTACTIIDGNGASKIKNIISQV